MPADWVIRFLVLTYYLLHKVDGTMKDGVDLIPISSRNAKPPGVELWAVLDVPDIRLALLGKI